MWLRDQSWDVSPGLCLRVLSLPYTRTQDSACPFPLGNTSVYLALEPSGLSLWVQPRARCYPMKAPCLSLPFGGTGLHSGLRVKGTQLSGPQNVPAQQGSDFRRRTEPFCRQQRTEGRPWRWLPCCSLALLPAGSCFKRRVNRVSESLQSLWPWDTQLDWAEPGLECGTWPPNLGQLPWHPIPQLHPGGRFPLINQAQPS